MIINFLDNGYHCQGFFVYKIAILETKGCKNIKIEINKFYATNKCKYIISLYLRKTFKALKQIFLILILPDEIKKFAGKVD